MTESDRVDLHTVDEIAHKLRMSPTTVRRYIRAGKLDAFRLDGGWRVSQKALRDFLDGRKNSRRDFQSYETK